MDAVLSWMKPIIYFSIFLTVLLQLLPNEKYKKYIRFFAGLLMIVLVLRPVLNLFGTEDLSEKIFSESFYQEQSEEIELDMGDLEDAASAYYESLLEENISENTDEAEK